jgi:hypothetical protein
MLPYGSVTMYTWSRRLSDQWPRGGLENHSDPYVFHQDMIIVWTITLSLIPVVLRYRHASEMWSSVSRYLVRSCCQQGHSTHSCLIPSPWPTHTMRNFMAVISPSGPRVSIHHADEQIPVLTHTPQPIPSKYLRTPFWSSSYRMAFDAMRVASGDID